MKVSRESRVKFGLTGLAKGCPVFADSLAVANVTEGGPSAHASAKDDDTPKKFGA